jgi:RNA polymerase sigma-70 factor (ECF subfamily)
VDKDEAEQIVRTNQERVFRMLARLVGSRDRVEDLAQEVFLRLFRALPLFRGEAALSTYIHRITVNVAQDEWARRRRHAKDLAIDEETLALTGNSPSAEQRTADRQLLNLIEAALETLSYPERAAFVLYHQEERSYADIAKILDLPVGTVRTHLHRGREKVRAMVMEQMS